MHWHSARNIVVGPYIPALGSRRRGGTKWAPQGPRTFGNSAPVIVVVHAAGDDVAGGINAHIPQQGEGQGDDEFIGDMVMWR